jgi:hypothetical protein
MEKIEQAAHVAKYKTRDEVAAKIDWEGSLFEAMEYGIAADDMPDEELRIAWYGAQASYEEWMKRAESVLSLLNTEDA